MVTKKKSGVEDLPFKIVTISRLKSSMKNSPFLAVADFVELDVSVGSVCSHNSLKTRWKLNNNQEQQYTAKTELKGGSAMQAYYVSPRSERKQLWMLSTRLTAHRVAHGYIAAVCSGPWDIIIYPLSVILWILFGFPVFSVLIFSSKYFFKWIEMIIRQLKSI